MKKRLLLLSVVLLQGCVTVPEQSKEITDEKKTFIYEYAVPGTTKTQLFKSARNFLATDYKNSKAVSRVEDEADGTIIGKALFTWHIHIDSLGMKMSIPCSSNYNIIFISKNEKARLQLELIGGSADPTRCGHEWPTKAAYPQVVSGFDAISSGLSNALTGKAAIDSLKNF